MEEQEQDTKQCPYCKENINIFDTTCKYCGESLIYKQQGKKCKEPLLIIITVLTLCIICFSLFVNNKSVDKELEDSLNMKKDLYQIKVHSANNNIWVNTELTGKHIKKIRVKAGRSGRKYAEAEFDKERAKILENITSENIGKEIGIFYDNKLYKAPIIREVFKGGKILVYSEE